MIEKNGIMSLTLTHPNLENCIFVIKDTMKFLVDPLAKLCKSFKVPE